MMNNPAGARLRALLANERPLVVPGVYDALTALLVERAGFGAGYVSGASVSMTRIGRADLGLATFTELSLAVTAMAERVSIPLVVDADNGFGNALNVQRTVRELERAGAAAIQLEDQTAPKRCGHFEGKQLIPVGEMLGKIRAALDARRSQDTMIVARTDAVAVDGMEAALERGAAYAEAGADVLFVESPTDREQLGLIGASLGSRIPLLANMVEGGKTPLTGAAELGGLGFAMVIFPGAMVRVVIRAAEDYLATLKRDGSTRAMLDRMLSFGEMNEVIGLDELLESGEKYADK